MKTLIAVDKYAHIFKMMAPFWTVAALYLSMTEKSCKSPPSSLQREALFCSANGL